MTLTEDTKRSTFAAFAAATRAGDVAAVAALSTPDAVVWHNIDERELAGEAALAGLTWVHRAVEDVEWVDDVMTLTPQGFVWQSVVAGIRRGRAIRVPTCVVVTLTDDGRVHRSEEYLDPTLLDLPARKP